MDKPILPGEGILHHAEGVDLLPAALKCRGLEVSLVNAMSREHPQTSAGSGKKQYTHILIDCMPSLGMLTINALAASERVLIPVCRRSICPPKALEQLLQTIAKVRRQINPKLQIDGILLTMVDIRNNICP